MRPIVFAIFLLAGFVLSITVNVPYAAIDTTSPSKVAISASSFNSWLEDDFKIKDQLTKYDVHGAGIALLDAGAVTTQGNYPDSDIFGDRDYFRWGSVSQVVAAMATMKATSDGKMKPDAEANEYVRKKKEWRIDDTYLEPIRIWHLMTGTSGIDNKWVGNVAQDEAHTKSLDRYVELQLPPRIHEPARYHCSGSQDATLLGYLISHATDTSYSSYVEDNIFSPLNMSDTDVTMNKDIQSKVSFSYDLIHDESGTLTIQGYWRSTEQHTYFNTYPGEGVIGPLSDLAKLGTSFLSNATDALSSAYKTMMMNRQWSFNGNDLLKFGMGYGFYQRAANGLIAEEIVGNTGGHFASLHLFPEVEQGLALVCDSDCSKFAEVFVDAFLNEYYPDYRSNLKTPESDDSDVAYYQAVRGSYLDTGVPRTTFHFPFVSGRWIVADELPALETANRHLGIKTFEQMPPASSPFLVDYYYYEIESTARHTVGSGVFRRHGDFGPSLAFDQDGFGNVLGVFGGANNVQLPPSTMITWSAYQNGATVIFWGRFNIVMAVLVLIMITGYWWPIIDVIGLLAAKKRVSDAPEEPMSDEENPSESMGDANGNDDAESPDAVFRRRHKVVIQDDDNKNMNDNASFMKKDEEKKVPEAEEEGGKFYQLVLNFFGNGPLMARAFGVATVTLNMLIAIGHYYTLYLTSSPDGTPTGYGLNPIIMIILFLPFISAILTTLMFIFSICSFGMHWWSAPVIYDAVAFCNQKLDWKNRELVPRVHYLVIAITSTLFLGFTGYLNFFNISPNLEWVDWYPLPMPPPLSDPEAVFIALVKAAFASVGINLPDPPQ